MKNQKPFYKIVFDRTFSIFLTKIFIFIFVIVKFNLFAYFDSVDNKSFILGFNILTPREGWDGCIYDFCKDDFERGNYTTFYHFYKKWVESHGVSLPTLEGKSIKIILRNPKVISYWNPNRPTLNSLEKIAEMVNKTQMFVAIDVGELENLLLKYNKYTFNRGERPLFIFFEGIPYELIWNYLNLAHSYHSEIYKNLRIYISHILPLFYYSNVNIGYRGKANITLPHYLDFGSEDEGVVRANFIRVGGSVSSFNFLKFAWDEGDLNFLLVPIVVDGIEGFYVKFPYGFSIFYSNVSVGGTTPLPDSDYKGIIREWLLNLKKYNEAFNLAIDRVFSNPSCVYYLFNKEINLGDNYKVMDGFLWPNGSFFNLNNVYYFDSSTNKIKKFDEDKVYYCDNGKWVDLDSNEEICKKFGSLYPSYEVVWDNSSSKCLINDVKEHPVWYRYFNDENNKTLINRNLINSSTNKNGFLDCIDESGNIHKNGDIYNGKLCSAGIWTNVLSNIKHFYVNTLPFIVNITFHLKNYAKEPIKLDSWYVEGIDRGTEVELTTTNNKNLFLPSENFSVNLIIKSKEINEEIKNYTLFLNFRLNDHVCETPIQIKIPFRIQYSWEYLKSYHFSSPLVYKEGENKTNEVNLYLNYGVKGKLKDKRICNYIDDRNCYFIVTKVVDSPSYCNVSVKYNYFLNSTLPTYGIQCFQKIKKEDKLKICSGLIWKTTEYNYTSFCNGEGSICPIHCEEIPLIKNTFTKDFDFYTDVKESENNNYRLVVTITNIGNTKIRGISINLTDLTGICGLEKDYYTNANKLLLPNQQFSVSFILNPVGLCKIRINVTVDDPISKEKEIVINPFANNERRKIIKKDNPDIYFFYLLLVGFISFLIGLYYSKKEFGD